MEQSALAAKMETAAARQKAAVQKQAGPAPASGFFTVGWSGPSVVSAPGAAPVCPPIADSEADSLIASAATANQLQPALLRAVIRQESAFLPCAVSSKGAMGLMQIMPATADQLGVADPFDPSQNVQAGARYLKQLMERYKGDLKLALAAYNAGPNRVDGNPPAAPDIPETRDYVARILDALNTASTGAADMTDKGR